jgi:hypothetical protein
MDGFSIIEYLNEKLVDLQYKREYLTSTILILDKVSRNLFYLRQSYCENIKVIIETYGYK